MRQKSINNSFKASFFLSRHLVIDVLYFFMQYSVNSNALNVYFILSVTTLIIQWSPLDVLNDDDEGDGQTHPCIPVEKIQWSVNHKFHNEKLFVQKLCENSRVRISSISSYF